MESLGSNGFIAFACVCGVVIHIIMKELVGASSTLVLFALFCGLFYYKNVHLEQMHRIQLLEHKVDLLCQ